MLLIEAAEELLQYQSYHCVMLLAFALQSHAIFSLTSAWKKVEAMMPGKWKAIENKIGSGGNLITASLIEKYGDFNIIDDLAVKVRIASPLLHKVVTSAHDEYENEKDADDDEDSIENMMRRFVPKNSDCFRWQQFITQLIRRTHLSSC